MINEEIIDASEKKTLLSNIFSLALLQGSNYIFPLLTIPYLVRVIGPENFGLLAFATAIITYFMLITDYGFDLSATRQIAINRKKPKKISEIFNSVMLIKITLMSISFIIMLVFVFSFEKLREHYNIYLLTYGMVIGQVFSPTWFLQGMEKMKYITYLNILSKTAFTLLIFILVKDKQSYWIVPLLTSLGFICPGIISLIIIRKQFKIEFFFPPLQEIKKQLYDGWHVFFSSISISLYTVSSTFILGLFTNNTTVGYFSAADKLIQAAKGIYQPISRAIFPLISKKSYYNKEMSLLFIKRITIIAGGGMLIVSLFIFIFSEQIVNMILGKQYVESIILLKIMSFLPFIITLSNIFGIQTMLNFDYKSEFNKIISFAAIIGITMSLILVPAYNALGTAITMLSVELIVTIAMFTFIKARIK
ncbi:flippase [Photorhabdus luminescens]|nr:flippase [Photorhabdus luminescens]